MRDGDYRAVEVGERILERLARDDIKVVRRLVEDEQIHLGEHQLSKGQSGALAAAEHPDPLADIVPGEEEACERAADLVLCQ